MSHLLIAWTQVGVREDEGRPNRGQMVDAYLRSVGLDPEGNYPWCAAFVHWCFQEAGKAIPKTASVARLWDLANNYRVQEPQEGDVFIHLKPNGTGHTGFVEAVHPDGSISTCEGNTNEDGSREGNAVVAGRTRPRSYCAGFLRFT